jgi:hypothetical protein
MFLPYEMFSQMLGVAPIDIAILRGMLDQAYDEITSDEGGASGSGQLVELLKKHERKALERISSGSLQTVSGLGRMTTFEKYGPGQLTPTQIQKCWRWLIDCYWEVYQRINQCQANQNPVVDPPTDQAVKEVMFCRYLESENESYPDYTELNLPEGRRVWNGVLTW